MLLLLIYCILQDLPLLADSSGCLSELFTCLKA